MEPFSELRYNSRLVAGERSFHGKNILWKFRDEHEFAAQALEGRRGFYSRGNESDQRLHRGFNSHENLKSACHDFEVGWDKAGHGPKDDDFRAVIREEAYQITEGLGRDVAGYRPDVPLCVAGDPEHMFSLRDTRTLAPVLDMIVSTVAHCGVSDSAMMNRGAAISYWVDVIESCGIRVSITGSQSVCQVPRNEHNTPIYYGIDVVWGIKRAEEPLLYNRVSTSLMMPDVLRRLVFSLLEQNNYPDWTGRLSIPGMYGYPTQKPNPLVLEDNPLILKTIQSNYGYETLEEAISTLKDDIDRYLEENPQFEFRHKFAA